jgi:hypothetical protein
MAQRSDENSPPRRPAAGGPAPHRLPVAASSSPQHGAVLGVASPKPIVSVSHGRRFPPRWANLALHLQTEQYAALAVAPQQLEPLPVATAQPSPLAPTQ